MNWGGGGGGRYFGRYMPVWYVQSVGGLLFRHKEPRLKGDRSVIQ